MKQKTINIPTDCVCEVYHSLKVRIIYLNRFADECKKRGFPKASENIRNAIAKLTMIADRIHETPFT